MERSRIRLAEPAPVTRPRPYYFLSLLQKLAAPKEYGLDVKILEETNRKADPYIDVFHPDPLGIDPLDNIEVRYRPSNGKSRARKSERFWPFVKTMFEVDAEVLFDRLVRTDRDVPKQEADRFTLSVGKGGYTDALVELVPFIEVPGLKVPKSRFMFMLHDERFFDRLMPLDADRKESVSRKAMVQQRCYEPYEARIGALMKEADRRRRRFVRLDHDYWNWVCTRPEYEAALDEGAFARAVPTVAAHDLRSEDDTHWSPIRRLDETDEADGRSARNPHDELVAAMRAGECFQRYAFDDQASPRPLAERVASSPEKHHVPAFEPHRADCLDYLFLAGFNQNIIDFMNQDTSEILDSIDPIYPDSSDQSSDRFFVRYANHRAMITYVPKSRSLETGNDYIGACPYAFLIHVLALHNEFLARAHEHKTMTRIDRIEALIYGKARPDTPAMALLEEQEVLNEDDDLSRAEMAINQAKLAEFSQYERFRYANPFRYETERDVFDTLEELRGISRKKEALALAIKSLEDHASDLSRRQQVKLEEQRRADEEARRDREDEAARRQKIVDDDAARRGLWLNILLGMTGFFGAGQMFYWIGEKAGGKGAGGPDHPTAVATLFGHLPPSTTVGNVILAGTEIVMTLALLLFLAMLGYILWDARAQIRGLIAGLWRKLRQKFAAANQKSRSKESRRPEA